MEYEEVVYITEAALAEYLWNRLLDKGHIPTSDEIFDISQLVFDYLKEIGVLEIVGEDEE